MRLCGRLNRPGPALLTAYTDDGTKLIADNAHDSYRTCPLIERSYADNPQSILLLIQRLKVQWSVWLTRCWVVSQCSTAGRQRRLAEDLIDADDISGFSVCSFTGF